MLNSVFGLARSALFAMPPEEAHELTVRSLEMGMYPRCSNSDRAGLSQDVFGLSFPNPIGIAAGFDKDARAFAGVLGMGCGFAEVGTVTPKPQDGNPKPRVFRLVDDHAVINRLGFNNGGHAAALERLTAQTVDGIVGVNIGANKDSEDRAADYVAGLKLFNDVASYFTINISSPNTPGLRDLQAPAALDELLTRIMSAQADLISAGHPRRPIIVKIAPDIAEDDIEPIVGQLLSHNVDGIAVSNTTLARPGLKGRLAKEGGGLSGRPLFHRSTVMLARVYQLTGGRIPLIGIGGIDSGETALAKIGAGARLIQLYTGLIYEGPGLIGKMASHLEGAVRAAGVENIAELCGRDAQAWAAKSLSG